MAQRSLPQAGTGVGDSGPYSSDEWAEYFQIVYTGDQEATQGPLRRYANELVVSKAGLTITTGTGAGFTYGHWLVNDAALDITIALAAGGQERYDREVMVENNTNVAYNTNLALPAAYAAGIPRNSARIAILQGAEAGAAVLPALLTGPNYYMVELVRYLVTDAAVGAIDDRREFCEFSSELPDDAVVAGKIAAGGVAATNELANDIVDDTKAGNRIIQMIRRQGSSAADWDNAGSTDYTPTMVRQQVGCIEWAGGAVATALLTVTFPVVFSQAPLVLVSPRSTYSNIIAIVHSTIAASFQVIWRDVSAATHTEMHINWLAIGPE